VGTRVLGALAERGATIDWSRVHIWWGDERFLGAGDPERNETGAREALLDVVPIPADHVHAMPADTGQGVEAAAMAYADELAAHSDDGYAPDFDVLLLGMGPEGHVASLFPGMPEIHAAQSAVPIENSPKPPPTRISLSLAAIRSAREVWVVAAGAGKADAAAAALSDATSPDDVPAAGARGRVDTVFWLDRAAAGRS
jgi:6-phosphogluconolactonase